MMSAWLLAWVVPIPLLLAALLCVRAARSWVEPLTPWAALPAFACALWLPDGGLTLPGLFLGMRIELDPTARGFLLFTSALWCVAGWAARAYHAADQHRLTLWGFWLLTLAGNLWLIVAADAAGFYAGYALMTFAGYGLVVHNRSDEAWRAGRVYLVMAVLGEAALLAGLLLRVGAGGGLSLPLTFVDAAHEPFGTMLLFAGFGVKAGLAGLHMWLPLAHPVAPTPASAVLSGAMIKAGVLGWMRFLPLGGEAWPLFGQTVIVLGLCALFGAVLVGVAQRAAKTVLAYSSISQMGFLTVGIGAALASPHAWPALGAAVALYALHHGLAKGALFLAVAALPSSGWRRTWGWVVLALPALALAGLPWTSGMVAKSALKAELVEVPLPWAQELAVLLSAGAVGTTLLLARFAVTLAAERGEPRPGMGTPWLISVGLSAGLVWFIAPFPSLVDGAGMWAAARPILLGVAISVGVAYLRPWSDARAPLVAAGDLLTWIAPGGRAAWRGLHAVAGWSDRPRRARGARAREWISAMALRCEQALRRFAVAGSLLLALLALATGVLWR